MKILYVTTIGGTMRFFTNFIESLISEGHTVDIAANDTTSKVPDVYHELNCKIYHISCLRSPLKRETLTTIRELKRIVEENHYDIVHCHTPIAAMCTRLACRKARKKGTKVYYTAHGFHFYKGAPLKNWLVFYPIEKLCARWTDVLITINKEDYALAQQKLKAKEITYVPGVGIDVEKFSNVQVDKIAKRREIGVPEDAFLLLSVGELNENKNHATVIKAIAKIPNDSIHYVIAGKGPKKEYLENLAKELHVNVHLPGFRRDVAELYKVADVLVFPSIREGLGMAAIEGMASGLPLIVSDNRGAKSYAVHGVNAIVCPVGNNANAYADAILSLVNDKELRNSMSEYNFHNVAQFDVLSINEKMKEMYGLNK